MPVGMHPVRRLSDCYRTRTIIGQSFETSVRDRSSPNLTKVPRSYQTSEMYGFRRIAREYASRASRY